MDSPSGFEDLDEFWKNARTPKRPSGAHEAQEDAPPEDSKKNATNKNNSKKSSSVTNRVVYRPNFEDALSNQNHTSMSKFVTALAKKKIFKGGNGTPISDAMSPSAISAVSTAPPSTIKAITSPDTYSSKLMSTEGDLIDGYSNEHTSDTLDPLTQESVTYEADNSSQQDEGVDGNASSDTVEKLTKPNDPTSVGISEREEHAFLGNVEKNLRIRSDDNGHILKESFSGNENSRDSVDMEMERDLAHERKKIEKNSVILSSQDGTIDSNNSLPGASDKEDKAGDEDEKENSPSQNLGFIGNNIDDYEDDDDKEGLGFQMTQSSPYQSPSPNHRNKRHVENQKMVASRLENRFTNAIDGDQSAPSERKNKKKQARKKSPTPSSESESDSSQPPPKIAQKRPKPAKVTPSTIFSKGYQVANHQYESIPANILKARNAMDDGDMEGCRRSKRLRVPPLQFWKNERMSYEMNKEYDDNAYGDMPVVGAVIKALPTPYKKRRLPPDAKKKSNKKVKKTSTSTDGHSSQASVPFDDSALRKKYEIIDGQVADIWDECQEEVNQRKVVSYNSQMVLSSLPITRNRDPSESKIVGSAGQAFNIADAPDIPGWIAGQLSMPPMSIKDAEGVGLCSQVFFVHSCQPKSLEMALGDPEDDGFDADTAQRFLFSAGDSFHVPPNNVYRIENHSKSETAKLFWTIIRPRSSQK